MLLSQEAPIRPDVPPHKPAQCRHQFPDAVHNNLDSISHMFTSVKTLSPIYSITEFPLFTCSKYNRVGKRCKDIQKVRLKCGISIPAAAHLDVGRPALYRYVESPAYVRAQHWAFYHTLCTSDWNAKSPSAGVGRGVKKRGFILNKCNMTFGIFISVWVVPDIAAMTSSRHLGLTALRWGLPLLDQSIAINFFSSTSFLVSSFGNVT